MSEKSYQAADVRRKTAELLGEVAATGMTITIHCASVLEKGRLYNSLNVQRFRRKMSPLVSLHRDGPNCAVVLSPKALREDNKMPKNEEAADAVDKRAAKALKAHKKMAKEVVKKWKPLPPHEHPQLTSEPDDVALSPVTFQWRRTVDGREDDIHYWCDADCDGFMVAPDVIPDRCPRCGNTDTFARDGAIAPYLKEARRLRSLQNVERRKREEFVIEPKEA